jgi:hypothetical protein
MLGHLSDNLGHARNGLEVVRALSLEYGKFLCEKNATSSDVAWTAKGRGGRQAIQQSLARFRKDNRMCKAIRIQNSNTGIRIFKI